MDSAVKEMFAEEETADLLYYFRKMALTQERFKDCSGKKPNIPLLTSDLCCLYLTFDLPDWELD